jgi:hypothetical protein
LHIGKSTQGEENTVPVYTVPVYTVPVYTVPVYTVPVYTVPVYTNLSDEMLPPFSEQPTKLV